MSRGLGTQYCSHAQAMKQLLKNLLTKPQSRKVWEFKAPTDTVSLPLPAHTERWRGEGCSQKTLFDTEHKPVRMHTWSSGEHEDLLFTLSSIFSGLSAAEVLCPLLSTPLLGKWNKNVCLLYSDISVLNQNQYYPQRLAPLVTPTFSIQCFYHYYNISGEISELFIHSFPKAIGLPAWHVTTN